MIVIGLTGSIGMGKSTVATLLRRFDVPVHDADATVHALLTPQGKAFLPVAAAFPYNSHPNLYGKNRRVRYIRRASLAALIFKNDAARLRLEAIMHPLVNESQAEFIRLNRIAGRKIVALEIPLLFETGAENFVDVTLVATATRFVQQARVMARPGMDAAKFAAILQRQLPDGEKRARADYIVHTGLGLAQTMKELKLVLADIQRRSPVQQEKRQEKGKKHGRPRKNRPHLHPRTKK